MRRRRHPAHSYGRTAATVGRKTQLFTLVPAMICAWCRCVAANTGSATLALLPLPLLPSVGDRLAPSSAARCSGRGRARHPADRAVVVANLASAGDRLPTLPPGIVQGAAKPAAPPDRADVVVNLASAGDRLTTFSTGQCSGR